MSKGSVAVTIAGQEYRIRNDGDVAEAQGLERVARMVDATMVQIKERTGMVDTRDLAVLTALNLARELVGLRDDGGNGAGAAPDPRLREIIELVEAELEAVASAMS